MAASNSTVSTGQKRSVAMICAHEPSADPRIHWEAHYASTEFDVTVLGFAGNVPGPVCEEGLQTYRTIRLPRREISGVRFFLLWLAALTPFVRVTGVILAAALLPILALVEVTFRARRWTGRAARMYSQGTLSETAGAPQPQAGFGHRS